MIDQTGVAEPGSMRWIAVYTQSKQERIAAGNIARQGYDTYCPMVKQRRSHARKVEFVLRPLFPSYVFVGLEYSKQQWSPLLNTKGVQSIVRFGEKLGVLPDAFIHQLRQAEMDGMLSPDRFPKFAPGELVTVTDGPFKDLIAKVLTVPAKDRTWLLLDLMGQSVRVQHDTWSLTRK